MTASATNRAVLRVSPRSWWMEEALRVNPGKSCPPLRDTVDADVCVVGGGYMGLWTAYELTRREPSLHVVVLEADICGAGEAAPTAASSQAPGIAWTSSATTSAKPKASAMPAP